jgi:hypothetical protein
VDNRDIIILFVKICFFVTGFWSFVRLVNVTVLPARVRGAPRCQVCRYEATSDTVRSGRCPECGLPYEIAGIETPMTRFRRDAGLFTTFIACLYISLLMGMFAATTVNNNRTGALISNRELGWFIVACVVVGGVFFIWVLVKHNRLEREVRTVIPSKTTANETPPAPVNQQGMPTGLVFDASTRAEQRTDANGGGAGV